MDKIEKKTTKGDYHNYQIRPIAWVKSPYTQKFAIPRQPYLVPAAKIHIVLEKEFGLDSIRGLADFACIWVQFIFHAATDEGWAQMVRPPRLGGNKKMGVFATRSPRRPNHLGLSLLNLDKINLENGRVVLYCSGADLLDGTPVVDIKPYLPFIEARSDVAAGFAVMPPPILTVKFLPQSGVEDVPNEVFELIKQSLAQDPRPAYHHFPEREYIAEIAHWQIRFQINNCIVWINSVQFLG